MTFVCRRPGLSQFENFFQRQRELTVIRAGGSWKNAAILQAIEKPVRGPPQTRQVLSLDFRTDLMLFTVVAR
jgi:hypothetical protein